MKKLLLLFVIFLNIYFVDAQQWEWAIDIGEPGFEGDYLVKTNDSGDIFTAVSYEWSSYLDFYAKVTRRTKNGNILWSDIINGYPNNQHYVTDFSIDQDNNVFVSGFFSNSFLFAEDTLYSPVGWSEFLVCYDESGQKLSPVPE